MSQRTPYRSRAPRLPGSTSRQADPPDPFHAIAFEISLREFLHDFMDANHDSSRMAFSCTLFLVLSGRVSRNEPAPPKAPRRRSPGSRLSATGPSTVQDRGPTKVNSAAETWRYYYSLIRAGRWKMWTQGGSGLGISKTAPCTSLPTPGIPGTAPNFERADRVPTMCIAPRVSIIIK